MKLTLKVFSSKVVPIFPAIGERASRPVDGNGRYFLLLLRVIRVIKKASIYASKLGPELSGALPVSDCPVLTLSKLTTESKLPVELLLYNRITSSWTIYYILHNYSMMYFWSNKLYNSL